MDWCDQIERSDSIIHYLQLLYLECFLEVNLVFWNLKLFTLILLFFFLFMVEMAILFLHLDIILFKNRASQKYSISSFDCLLKWVDTMAISLEKLWLNLIITLNLFWTRSFDCFFRRKLWNSFVLFSQVVFTCWVFD